MAELALDDTERVPHLGADAGLDDSTWSVSAASPDLEVDLNRMQKFLASRPLGHAEKSPFPMVCTLVSV
jgi:hypothetical protein